MKSSPAKELNTLENEKELVEAAKENPEMFGQLYDLYIDDVYSYIYNLTGNQHKAEDLTSQTFFQALDKINSFQWKNKSFVTWLFRIARNLVISNWRKKKSNFSLEFAKAAVCNENNPEEITLNSEQNEVIRTTLQQLPIKQREVIELKFSHEFSNKKIALIIGRSEGAVEQLLFRAIRNLRQKVEF